MTRIAATRLATFTLVGLLVAAIASPAAAQGHDHSARIYRMPANLSGPRFGLTVLPAQLVDTISSRFDHKIQPVISQFGWQFETQLFTADSGMTVLTELVGLVGGLE
ncbi:MAG: hypothetical protein LC713_02075, partial [Actinobacteria bacterium]|nr:hypothetical protein [Actinomycetota bacterium]